MWDSVRLHMLKLEVHAHHPFDCRDVPGDVVQCPYTKAYFKSECNRQFSPPGDMTLIGALDAACTAVYGPSTNIAETVHQMNRYGKKVRST